MFERVVGKRRDQTGSEREGNVPVWKQEVFPLCDRAGSFLLTILTASPWHLSNIHQFMRIGQVLLYSVLRGLQKMEASLVERTQCHLQSGECYYIAYI